MNTDDTTLGDIGELDAIARIGERLPGHGNVIVGAGDDAAVVRTTEYSDVDLVLTSDPVIEGTHFSADTPPECVGHKAVGRVLSDLAAMGATPNWALVDIVAPARTSVIDIDHLYGGALDLAAESNLIIVGGDLSEGPALQVHVFGIGEVPRGRAVLRSGAHEGDRLFVTGSLGASALGRHLNFEPRLREGAWLRDWATAMIDISDGLASDLRHLTTMSGVGCHLETSCIPIAEAVEQMANRLSPLDHALRDGEDFELLFTVPKEKEDAFTAAWEDDFELACTRIGVMTAHAGIIRCVAADGSISALEDTGFSHFR